VWRVQEQNDAPAGGGGGAGEDRPVVRAVRRLAHRDGRQLQGGGPRFLVEVVREVVVLVKAGSLLDFTQRGDGRKRDTAAGA
jgi:hypothetical protein